MVGHLKTVVFGAAALIGMASLATSASAMPVGSVGAMGPDVAPQIQLAHYYRDGWHRGWHHPRRWGWHHPRGRWGWHRPGPYGMHRHHWRGY